MMMVTLTWMFLDCSFRFGQGDSRALAQLHHPLFYDRCDATSTWGDDQKTIEGCGSIFKSQVSPSFSLAQRTTLLV